MKTFIAAIGTAIVLASSASAMVIAGDHLPSQPGGQSQFATMGHVAEKDVSASASTPAGDYSTSGSVNVSIFETDDTAHDQFSGGAAF